MSGWSAALLLGVSVSAGAVPAQRANSFGEHKLTAMIKGRVAGNAVNCISLRRIRSVEVVDGIGIIFETDDRTRYLNRPATGALQLDSAWLVKTDTHLPDLCRADAVRLLDPGTRRLQATVNLGSFVPYRLPGD